MKKHGKVWVAVAAMVPGRTRKQCRERWTHALDPANGKKGKWTPAEDEKLAEAVKKHGKNWVAVAAMVPGRMNNQCQQRWTKSLQASTNISAEADGVTTDLFNDLPTDPATPAAPLPSAAASRASRRNWKLEEDAELTEVVKKHGKKWDVVAKLVPDRTIDQCHQRWTHIADRGNGNKGKPRRNWKPEEDAELTEAVKKHGKKWSVVATLVPDRTDLQCRQQWVRNLDPDCASNTVEEGCIGNDEALV